jgi:hypothetical protein
MGYNFLPGWSEVTDLVSLTLLPYRFKLRNIRRIELESGREILIVGTLHHLHLSMKQYSLADLENLIINYSADVIGLEARPLDLSRGLLPMAPIEMAQAALIARRRNIPIFGFDSWDELENETAAAKGEPLDFNSAIRNDQMVQQLLAGVGSASRTLALTGYSHVRPFVERLLRVGSEREISTEEKKELFATRGGKDLLDPELQPSLELTIEHLEGYLAHFARDNAWSRRVRRKLERLREMRREVASHKNSLSY